MPNLSEIDASTIADNIVSLTRDTMQFTSVIPSIIMRTKLDNAEAMQYKSLYPEWTVGETYELDWIVRYNDELYRVGQPSITASSEFVPGATGTESIYSHISIDDEGYEYWKEWDGITGLYDVNDVVRDPYDEQLYICISPNCTYGPPHERPDFWQLYEAKDVIEGDA